MTDDQTTFLQDKAAGRIPETMGWNEWRIATGRLHVAGPSGTRSAKPWWQREMTLPRWEWALSILVGALLADLFRWMVGW